MQWLDVAIKVLGLFAPVFTFFIGWISSKYKEEKRKRVEKELSDKEEYDTMRETCKITLRKSLKDDYDFYVHTQKWCSIEDKADVEIEYKLYHEKFNGNGRGTMYYEAIKALPNEKPEEE